MSNIRILDCTLRDGGYITKWYFGFQNIKTLVDGLTQANIDIIEVGYLNKDEFDENHSIFKTIQSINNILPKERKTAMFLAMADVEQFSPENLEPHQNGFIDGIRVVFYKHQIEKALNLCEAVVKNGYKLFVQPMVTIDYAFDEYAQLIDRIALLTPSAISIVDSFGYMNKIELKNYFDLLHNKLPLNVAIGFHSHNNMQHSVLNTESLFSYPKERQILIDSSLYGMGRGAGNLNTELIINYYNESLGIKYDLNIIIGLISDIIFPIHKKKSWGYSPYFFLTALYHCHPNYVTYLLEEREVTINVFEKYLKSLPEDMKLKCRKPSVIELFDKFARNL